MLTLTSPATPPMVYVSPFIPLQEFLDRCVEAIEDAGCRLVIRDDVPHIGVMRAAINLGLEVTVATVDGRVRMIARKAAAT